MCMTNKFLTCSLFATLLSTSALVFAENPVADQPRWFQIELIFFEPLETAVTGEVWPEPKTSSEAELSVQTSSTELIAPLQPIVIQDNPGITPRAFQLLNPANFSMTDLTQRLLDSKQYRVLSHIAWRQPTVKLADSRAVHVHDELMQEDALIPVSDEPLLLNNLPDPIEQLETEIKKKRFYGTVTVNLARYLHLKADITYYNPEVYLAEQIAEQNIDTPNIEYFKMFESRRMRSNKIHYLDHPYFGIIALITPYEHESKKAISQPAR